MLTDAGITLAPPPQAHDRVAAAQAGLHAAEARGGRDPGGAR